MPAGDNIKVSVYMTTYNHQVYITQAIESVLMQKTIFPFEIVIGDDNSKDDSEKICREYVLKYPGKVKYHRRDPNMGMMPNLIKTMEDCDGKYIAICEGDDYWTDENKLQSQADFLEDNPGYSLCAHNHTVSIKGELLVMNKNVRSNVLNIKTEDYLLNPFFHMTSFFFRNDALPAHFPDWFRNVLGGDHFLVLFLSLKGRIGYLNRNMSVYRHHGSSVSFTRSAYEIKQNFVKHLALFDEYSAFRYHKTIDKVIRSWDLLYKVYEPVSYFNKLGYLLKNTGFYLKNFKATGGLKLLLKYILPARVTNCLRRIKNDKFNSSWQLGSNATNGHK